MSSGFVAGKVMSAVAIGADGVGAGARARCQLFRTKANTVVEIKLT
jgi:hypothetical protein